MIVKLQRSLETFPDGPPTVLIYDENHRHQTIQPLSNELRQVFGDRVKFYCHAQMRGTLLSIDVSKQVEDPGW